jgi:hypothetical protein
MNPGATAQLPISSLDDDAWDDLLSYIEERRVIPIVGPELLQVATDRGPRLLYDWLAEKLAGRLNVIEPVVKYHRELAAHNHGDQQQHVELARALYAQALIEPEHRTALLKEAASLVDAVPTQMAALRSVRVWSDRIHAAMHAPAASQAPAVAPRGVG